ncbi:MAG: PDZ domain-containing protein, partial [Hyphomicrobiaceae bacterium]|nr:PDZ domain-containing protein [Hyphomicrobiaceae bacterium]
MRRTLAWALMGGLGLWLGAGLPRQAMAQDAPKPPAEASGQREPGRLGVEVRDLTQQSVRALGLSQEHAILVVLPVSGSPAERAGLRPGDVIVELEGTAVGRVGDFAAAVQGLGAGRTIALGVLRGSGRLMLQVTLSRPADIPQGDPAETVERRIAAFEAILATLGRERLPQDWAAIQNNLGAAYADRARGDLAKNLEQAIAAYLAALTIRTREALPREWATTQNNLGNAYRTRIRGERADNLEQAIAAFQAALTVRTREALPYEWAQTQHSLGAAYAERVRGERADNLEQAIAAFQAAITITTREALPREWAQTQNNLGNAYADRIRGERADNLEQAIAAYQAALTVFTREVLPRDHLRTARLAGSALLEARKWSKAGVALASARDAFLLLFGQGLNEAEARDLITRAGPLFSEAAYAAAQHGESEKALELATEGRARMMAVGLKLQGLDLNAEKRKRLDELRADIRVTDRTFEATQGTERAAAVEKLIGLRQELLGLVKEADAAGAKSGSVPAQARALVAEGGALVVPIVTTIGGKILIVASGSDPRAQGLTPIDLPDLTSDRLDALIRGGDKAGGWLGAYAINNLPEKEQDRRWPEWLAAIDNAGPELWRLLGGRLDGVLRRAAVKPGARVVWLPTGALGILPLGIAQDPQTKRRLADRYEIVYAPSLEALTAARG